MINVHSCSASGLPEGEAECTEPSALPNQRNKECKSSKQWNYLLTQRASHLTVIGTQISLCQCSKWIMWLWKSQAQSHFKNNEFARTHHEPSSEVLNLISCFVGLLRRYNTFFCPSWECNCSSLNCDKDFSSRTRTLFPFSGTTESEVFATMLIH